MPPYSQQLSEYVRDLFAVEDEVLRRIRGQIRARGLPQISVRAEEGCFLQFLVATSGAKRALEFGTLGGYSGVWIARALPEGGRLITVEKDAHHAQVAREHFELAQLSDVVEVLQGEATGLFTQLSGKGPFDFLFIDAEKAAYPAYLAWALENLSRGGVLAAHNAFLHGDILDRASEDPGVRGMREFNAQLAKHPNLFSTIFPAGDGTAIAVMRG